LLAKLYRIAILQVIETAERCLLHFGCIRSQAPNSLKPIAWFERRLEFDRMRAVDAIKIRPHVARFGIDGLDSRLESGARI
jgi:hypothetical protein